MTKKNGPVFAFNGIDGTTGEPFYPAATFAEMNALAQNRPEPQETAQTLYKERMAESRLQPGAVRDGFDPRDLASSGWGVVFPQNVDPEVREALAPLVEHRRRQATVLVEHRFRELDYRPDESKRTFLKRYGVAPSRAADPDRLPYYLLLVGNPGEIPWSFQHHLAVQYAVGRLDFDTAEEYACYAETVIAAETGKLAARPRRLVLFGTAHDQTTELMAEHLIAPLRTALSSSPYPVETILADCATKERLARLLGGDDTPALLFTASHGMSFPAGNPQQLARQGALLCQNSSGGGIGPDVYLTGEDVAAGARPAGLMAFFYACHGAGTPQFGIYPQRDASGNGSSCQEEHRLLSPSPFVAHLPRRLLGHPAGGALAVIGHVERTWGYSFLADGLGSQTEVFEDCLKRLLDGCPVGAALEPFSLWLGQLATELTSLLEEPDENRDPAEKRELVRLWTAHNDARAYALLGDPAVRLPTSRSVSR